MAESPPSLSESWSVAVAIMGARMHYAVPSVLAGADRLERFYTDFYIGDGIVTGLTQRVLRQMPVKALRRAAMRSEPSIPGKLVNSFPGMGVLFALSMRLAKTQSQREDQSVRFGRWFGQRAAKQGFGRATVTYGINTASVEWFENAHQAGLLCILEQCSAPYPIYDKLAMEEYQRWHTWERSSRPHHNLRSFQREAQEWELANLILCGSQFVIDGLISLGVAKEKCKMIPYAVNVDGFEPKQLERAKPENRLKVLFLGGVCIMKGIQYVHKALELMDSAAIETKAAGSIMINAQAVKTLQTRIELLGLVPRKEVGRLLAWADVLVLPSICEGSALVTYEALASGVPVITTSNAGSPIVNGMTGFIVPIRDAARIAERLDQLATDRGLLTQMSESARHYAEEHLSWETYRHRLLAAIESLG